MLKTIILEDEDDSRQLLSSYLKDYFPQISLLASVESVKVAIEAVHTFHPDVVFMDIQLRGETGFDLLEQFTTVPFEIIFTTAYESYMLRAIKLSAIDYLLKPIHLDDLRIAIEKVEKKINRELFHKSLEVLLNNFRTHSHEHKIAIPSTDGFLFVKIADIIYLRSDGAYTYFFLKEDGRIMTSKNIAEYEELLTDHNFFRVHKSSIVNLNEIVRYVRGEGGNVIMSNNASVDVSRRRKDEFLKKLSRA